MNEGKEKLTERDYGDIYEKTFRNIGELIYLYGNIEPLINILLCESLGISEGENIIRSVLNHIPSNKRIEMIEERIKASQVDGEISNELSAILDVVKDIKIAKSMRDVVSHCSWSVTDDIVYFVQSNSMDYEKAMRRMNNSIERLVEKTVKSKTYDDPNELARAVAKAFDAEAPRKNSNDLQKALLSARRVMDFFVKRHKEKSQENPAVYPS